MKSYCGLVLIVFLLSLKVTFGQRENNSALDKRVTIEVKNETIASVFEKISLKTQIYFSYDASLIDDTKKIDASLSDKTIKEILDLLLESKFIYRVLDDQVIIAQPEDEKVKKKRRRYSLKNQ